MTGSENQHQPWMFGRHGGIRPCLREQDSRVLRFLISGVVRMINLARNRPLIMNMPVTVL